MYDQDQPARLSWRPATEHEELNSAPSWRSATWAGNATAQQIVRIQQAWDAAVSPMSPTRDAAVAELLRAASDAKWSAAELAAWMDRKLDDVTAARAAVLEELRSRIAAARRAA